jgi:hypothetical protein
MRAAQPQQSRDRRAEGRAVATIVGAALLALALLVIIAFYIYTTRQQYETQKQLADIIQSKLQAPLLAQAVQGYYIEANGQLEINITNNAPRTILVTGLAIIWTDNTTTIIDRWNTTLQGIQMEITTASGTTTPIDKLPAALAPGSTLHIEIQTTKTVSSIAATISASPIVAVIPIVKPPPTNVTAPPPPTPQAQLCLQLNHTAYSWTQTYNGTIYGANLQQALAQPQSITLLQGTATTTLDPQALATEDGNTITVTQTTPQWTVVNITRTTNNTIYAEDFNTCNVINTSLWTTDGGNWTDTLALHMCGIAQMYETTDLTSPPKDGLFASGEYVAYNTAASLPEGEGYYIFVHINQTDFIGSHDIVIFDPLSETIITLGINSSVEILLFRGNYYLLNSYGNLLIRLYNNGEWTTLAQSSNITYSTYTWYSMLIRYEPSTSTYTLYFLDENASNIIASISAVIQASPSLAGTGTGWSSFIYYSNIPDYIFGVYNVNYSIGTAVYDDFIISKYDPRLLNFTIYINDAPAAGISVEVYDSTGGLVASGVTDSYGFVSLNVGHEPVLRNAIIHLYNATLGLNVTIYTNETTFYGASCGGILGLCGGENYSIYIERAYPVDLRVSTFVNTSLDLYGVKLFSSFSVNASGSYSLMVYNWTAQSWVMWSNGKLSQGSISLSTGWYPYPESGIVASNGTINLRLRFVSPDPIEVNVDALNAYYSFWNYTLFDGFMVAVGGSSLAEVYDTSSGGFSYLYDVPLGTLFNGSAAFTYDPLSRKLIVFNGSGVFAGRVSRTPGFELLSSVCRAEKYNPIVFAVNAGSSSYIVAVPGFDGSMTNDTYCTIDPSTGSLVAAGGLGSILGFRVSLDPARVYAAVAVNGSVAYLLVYDADSGEPVLVRFDASTLSWEVVGSAPGGYAVGLTVGGGYLWLLLERGSLYRIDPSTGNYTLVSVSLPFYPWGPGDRLEYIGGQLVFVRADGTREVWCITPPG